jgi:hypothetical protein
LIIAMDPFAFPNPPAEEHALRHVAYFVSAHGFGHATRACSVMAAGHALDANVCFDIFSAAPEFVFRDSLTGPFVYHQAIADIGLAQQSALVEDLPTTLARLNEFLPFDPFFVRTWADWLERLECELVVCDIAPLGLEVAEAAGLPAILIENFTWDFIYRGYLTEAPGLERHADYLASVFAKAHYWLQAEPFCVPAPRSSGTLAPIGRRPRTDPAVTRGALGLADGERLVLVTLGGVPDQAPVPLSQAPQPGVVYALAGAAETVQRDGPWLRLPHRSPVYYPDLLTASDAVIAKLGYSTLAEAYHAGVPFGYLPRDRFPESPIIAAFARQEMQAWELPPEVFLAGGWLPVAEQLLALPRRPHPALNGADQAAQFICDLLR